MLFLLPVVLAASPVKLAATGFTGANVDEQLLRVYSGHLGQQLSLQPGLKVSTPEDVSMILGLERQRQLLGCTEGSCTAELAGALGVDAVVTGVLAKVGTGYLINIRILAAGSAEPLAVYSARPRTDDELLDELGRAARDLAGVVLAQLAPPARLVRSVGAPRVLVPAVIGVALLAGSGVFYGLARGEEQRLRDDSPTLVTIGDVDGAVTTGGTEQLVSFALLCGGAAAVLTSLVLYLMGWPEGAPSHAWYVAPSASGLVIGGSLP